MKKSKIIAIIGVVASIIIIVTMLTINSRPYLQVSQVTSAPSKYNNKEIQVIGIVQGFSGGDFNLTENEHNLFVDVSSISVPSELENGLKVVVTGWFDSSLVLIAARQILTQCS